MSHTIWSKLLTSPSVTLNFKEKKMQVEFYEEIVKGKAKEVTKLHIKKTLQQAVTQVVPEKVVIRTATEQDKAEHKAEYDAFLAIKKVDVKDVKKAK